MKFMEITGCLIWLICITSCKKNPWDDLKGSTPDFLNQTVVYKTTATIPSPADSARGLFKDSVIVSRKLNKDDPDFISNIPNVAAAIRENYGFSFGYAFPDNSLIYFLFTAYAFPSVPPDFLLNKAYEHTSTPGTLRPLYLGSHNGFDGMNYFVNNVYPPDAGAPISKTFTSITFTKLTKIPLPPAGDNTAFFVSGHISGYCIDYYHKTRLNKYVHRWDFTVDFTDLLIGQ